jgi:hypothetical protein
VDDKERPMRSTQSTAEERLMRSTAKAAEEASRGEAKKQHRCEAQVSCGAPRNRGGTPRRGRRGVPMGGAGFVRSTKEPRGSTDARPKRSTDARRRFRVEHRGTEGEYRCEAEEEHRCEAKEEHRCEAEEEHRCEAQVSCGAPRNRGEATTNK